MFPAMLAVELSVFAPVLSSQVAVQLPMLPTAQPLSVGFAVHIVEIIVLVVMLPVEPVMVVVVRGLIPIVVRMSHGGGRHPERQK